MYEQAGGSHEVPRSEEGSASLVKRAAAWPSGSNSQGCRRTQRSHLLCRRDTKLLQPRVEEGIIRLLVDLQTIAVVLNRLAQPRRWLKLSASRLPLRHS